MDDGTRLNLSFSFTNETQYIFHDDDLTGLDGDGSEEEDYIFDRTGIRVLFITLYSLVFCCCFFGNLLVILVVTLSRRLRSITNFFLANLAVADFCVGVFCVFQNLSIYLIPSWVFGNFLCKMYQFIHSLSYTASIFILVVICMERYFAIIHPITCKQILTPRRLRLVMLLVWITSALYSAPKFMYIETITINTTNGADETICIAHRKKYNSKIYDLLNFGLLYLLPLFIMTILYTRIAIGLCESSRRLKCHLNASTTTTGATSHSHNINMTTIPMTGTIGTTGQPTNVSNIMQTEFCTNQQCSAYVDKQNDSNGRNQMNNVSGDAKFTSSSTWKSRVPNTISASSQNVLKARQRVIKMLIIVVLTFALCNLPFHARKMWQYWSDDYKGNSNFSTLLTPTTFLLTYFNSGINPMLYAFLSRKFRKGMQELLLCSVRGVKKHKINRRILERHLSENHPMSQTSMLHVGSVKSTKYTFSSFFNGKLDTSEYNNPESSTDGCSV
ncbi:trissin receptor-like [Chrysoperla carnea]|uniref:trissin receptor-like n=1 Tax=Chrysoperla carnea TaxID=189513 RepID=UPI001D08240A|nr:trissin receptor-like [Chrysoperla carnea]